jgi:hypothetical protein
LAAPAADFLARNIPLWLQKSFLVRSKIIYKKSYHTNQDSLFLHGYINPTNMNLTIYGVFLLIISAGFGYLFKFFGLTSCIIAHFIYDVAMFSVIKYAGKNPQSP